MELKGEGQQSQARLTARTVREPAAAEIELVDDTPPSGDTCQRGEVAAFAGGKRPGASRLVADASRNASCSASHGAKCSASRSAKSMRSP
jgi:hypothetical protein